MFGRSVYLTLISRRSNQFAGTRFLKRGGNSSVSSRLHFFILIIVPVDDDDDASDYAVFLLLARYVPNVAKRR